MIQKNYGAATIWLILALVIIAAGLYIFTKPAAAPETDQVAGVAPAPEPTPTPTPEPIPAPAPQTYTVNYSSTGGFTPSSLSVKVGDSVKFVAPAGVSMWVASDPHPTHTGYPAFDEKAAGAEYTFTFTTEGTYPFHNHKSAGHKGTITVTK